MNRQRSVALIAVGVIALLLFARWTWRAVAERYAVAALLEAGAAVAFESDYEERRLTDGHFHLHGSIDRNGLADFLDRLGGWTSGAPPTVARQTERPSGKAKKVHLYSNDSVRVLVENASTFAAIGDVTLGDAVGGTAAATLIDRLGRTPFDVESVACNAPLLNQSAIDHLLDLELRILSIGNPALDRCDLRGLRGDSTIEILWLCQRLADFKANPSVSRYDADALASVASMDRLRMLFLVSIDIDDGMAIALSKATRLERLHLSGCRISDSALETVRDGLSTTEVTFLPPNDDTDADAQSE